LDTQMINTLIVVLQQENRIYEELLKISKSKTNTVVEGKVSELESMVKLEQALVMQFGKLEKKREELIGGLSGILKLKPEEITVSELLKVTDSEQGKKLKECQDNLADTVSELKDINDLNAKLIQNSLDYINFSVNILTSAGASDNKYGNTGAVSEPKKRNLFDVKL